MDKNKQQQKTKQPPQTSRRHQNLFKPDHGEEVKQAQALTYVGNSPRLLLHLQQEIVKVHCKYGDYCVQEEVSSTCFLFFNLPADTSFAFQESVQHYKFAF